MPWLQLLVDTNRQQTEAVEAALLAVGALSVTLQDNADQPILEPLPGETPLWELTRVTGLFDATVNTVAAMDNLRQTLGYSLPEYRWEQLEDKDWELEWMKGYHPIDCGHGLWICPSWQQPPDPHATNLLLDPGLAFGTGTHPTTFLCLQWLAECAHPVQQRNFRFSGCSVIDYGCGSGILAIAALLLGAGRATGVDIDPQALLASRDNALRNGLNADLFPVFMPRDVPEQQSDIVLANILSGPLQELARPLADMTRAGGWLCLSGILHQQSAAVMDAYRPWFEFQAPRRKDEWICLVARKH